MMSMASYRLAHSVCEIMLDRLLKVSFCNSDRSDPMRISALFLYRFSVSCLWELLSPKFVVSFSLKPGYVASYVAIPQVHPVQNVVEVCLVNIRLYVYSP